MTNTVAGVLLNGSNARPSASSVSAGTLYADSVNRLVYQSDGTNWNLWASLGVANAGLTNPMTTTGDVIYSSDNSGTPARLARGATGTILTAGASIPAWSEPASKLLAIHAYSPGATTTLTHTSGGGGDADIVDVDATNMAVTFTAPASGNVLVRASAWSDTTTSAGTEMVWGLRESTSTISGTMVKVGRVGATSSVSQYPIAYTAYLTGISAGSHTYKLGFGTSGNTTTIRVIVGPGTAISGFGAGIMEVWSCP